MSKYCTTPLTRFVLVLISSLIVLSAAEKSKSRDDLKLKLLKPGQVIIAETFEKDSEDIQSWVQYDTKWVVKGGELVGSPSSLEYQQSHPGKQSGSSARIHIPAPACKDGFIVKFDFKSEKPISRASFWLGHHSFKLLIKDNQPSLQYFKTKKKAVTVPFKALNGPIKNNQWYSVIMETHSTHRAIQISGFEPIKVQGINLKKTYPVRVNGPKENKIFLDNLLLIKGNGLL
jgi:hypothetical protein